jgi:hypothetical protein
MATPNKRQEDSLNKRKELEAEAKKKEKEKAAKEMADKKQKKKEKDLDKSILSNLAEQISLEKDEKKRNNLIKRRNRMKKAGY